MAEYVFLGNNTNIAMHWDNIDKNVNDCGAGAMEMLVEWPNLPEF